MIRSTLIALLLMAPVLASAQQLPRAEDFLGRKSGLTLHDAVYLALQSNLSLRVARTRPAIAEEVVQEAKGAFDPTLSAEYGFEHRETPVATALQGDAGLIEADQWDYKGGIFGILPFGLSYSSNLNQTRLDSDSRIVSLEPEWRSNWWNEIRLPIMKDLIYNEANVAVMRTRIARNISDEEFRRELLDLVAEVENAYWALTAERARQRVEHKSVETARDLLEQTRVRYDVGVVSKVLVVQAEAGVAEREVAEIRANNRAETAQDELLNLTLAPTAEGFASTEMVPEEPTYIEYSVNLDVALEKAMELRPELGSARGQVEDAEVQLAQAENQRLPTVDLVGSYSMNGLAGSAKDASDILPGATPPNDQGGSRDTFSDYFRGDGAKGWAAGGVVEIPFPNTTARATVRKRQIEVRRARTELRRTEQQITLGVRKAVRLLLSAIDAVEAAERRRIAQEETLRAEQEKLRLGDSTPHDVLQFEEDLVEAEREKILALQAYLVAITGVERSQGTLLEARGISVANEMRRGMDR